MNLGISRSVVAGVLSIALLGGGRPAAIAEDVPAVGMGAVAADAPDPDIDPLEQSTNVLAINTAVRNMIGSNVRERGIDRWYNGVKQSRLAPHPFQPSGYRWHGVLSAAKAPMTIKIDDHLNFSVVINTKVYPASIYMCKTFKITRWRRAMDNVEHGKGVVVSWDAEGGFGHLQIDDGPAVWGFYSDIEMDGYRTLEAGQRVEATYEAVEDQDGFKWRTVHIKPVTS